MWEDWAERLQWYYSYVEFLFSPDLFVVGGGVSKHAGEVPAAAGSETPIVPRCIATMRGSSGAAASTLG